MPLPLRVEWIDSAKRVPAIIVLEGGGYSRGSEMGRKGQAGKNKLQDVSNPGEISRFHSQGRI